MYSLKLLEPWTQSGAEATAVQTLRAVRLQRRSRQRLDCCVFSAAFPGGIIAAMPFMKEVV
jgi:hypothetical protein